MAANNIKSAFAAGFKVAEAMLLDSSGFGAGLVGSLANGEDAPSYYMKGIQTADLAMPDPETTAILGNDIYLGAFTWGLGQAPAGSIEMGVYDIDLAVAAEATKRKTLGGIEMHVVGAREATYQDMAFILQSRAKSQDSGSSGLSLVTGYIVPKAEAAWLGWTGLRQREALGARMRIAVQMADVLPWTEALSDTDFGATEGIMLGFTAGHYLASHTFIGDGVTDTVVLDYTPAGDDTASPAVVHILQDGVALTPTTDFTVTPATKTITFQAGSIPAAGKVNGILYERL